MWQQAKLVAAQTPDERNRYVDFLRASSILVVITGHWLVATVYFKDGVFLPSKILIVQPATQWLTWIFQVMPIFFIVGGYSNGVSLESARRRNHGYADWLAGRLHRLVSPLLVLILAWGALAAILHYSGVSGTTLRLASRTALIPTWFLAIYIAVVLLAPLTYRAWRRWGFASFFAFVAMGAIVDWLFFNTSHQWAAWSNYFWVWLAVHHLGYAWRDGRLGSRIQLLAYSAVALAALATLILKGPYPLAMVGSPDPGISNTMPPKVTLVALGVFQFGLLLSIEKPMRRLLSRLRFWAATVLINSMIMTVYLWHITVMAIVISVLYAAGGFGLGIEPGTSTWWLTRPLWIGFLYLILVPVAALMAPLERRPRPADRPPPGAARQVVGAVLLCLGVAVLARFGFGDSPLPRLDIIAFLLVILGAALNSLLPRWSRSAQ